MGDEMPGSSGTSAPQPTGVRPPMLSDMSTREVVLEESDQARRAAAARVRAAAARTRAARLEREAPRHGSQATLYRADAQRLRAAATGLELAESWAALTA